MNNDLLLELFQRLDEPAARYAALDAYYRGVQPLAYLSPESKAALGNRFGRMSTNLCKLAVTALAERLRVTGFRGADLFADWLRNDLDLTSGTAHREALLYGDAYLLVWADRLGRPQVSVESPLQVTALTDPETRQITAGLKRWRTKTTTEAAVYLPDRIVRLRANQPAAAATGFAVVEELPNPLGTVPLVNLRNSDRVLDDRGVSEIDDLKPLVDGLNKSLVDLLTTSEYLGRPRRFATGIELVDTPALDADGNPVLDDNGEPVIAEANPFPESHRMMIAENPDARFGALPAADLSNYKASVEVLLSQIAAVSCLPPHYLGILHDNPSSADALRAAEASLTARAEARQQTFGRAWEHVARLMVAVRDGRDPDLVEDISVVWADAGTRSVAQESDAVTKLVQAGILPPRFALQRLGYTADEVAEIEAARTPEAPGAA